MKIWGWKRLSRGKYEFKEKGFHIQAKVARKGKKWAAIIYDKTGKFDYESTHERWTTANDDLVDARKEISRKVKSE